MNDIAYKPLYISDVQKSLASLLHTQKVELHLVVREGRYRTLEFVMPDTQTILEDVNLYENYFLAMLNNMVVSFGGIFLTIYTDTTDTVLNKIVKDAIKRFDLFAADNYRKGYGTYVNYINRMNKVLKANKFNIVHKDFVNKPAAYEGVQYALCNENAPQSLLCNLDLKKKCYCSLDVGGNSIKGAVVIDEKIAVIKEYPWFPTLYTKAHQLNDPLVLMLQFLNTCVTYIRAYGSLGELESGLKKEVDFEQLKTLTEIYERKIGKTINFDGICIGFPDILVNNKIAGGESYKHLGMRSCPNYEEEFEKTVDIDLMAAEYCKDKAGVVVINDGNAASIIVSVEQAFAKSDLIDDKGILAITVGTEMGTGYVSRCGTIQSIPLEGFQHVIDLGNENYTKMPPKDIRSTLSLNTGIAGTVQKYISQLGLFRMSIINMLGENKELFNKLVDEGLIAFDNDILIVQSKPKDMRGMLTGRLLQLLNEGNTHVKDAFKEMGKCLGVLIDQDVIIFPEIKPIRLISGGIVAVDRAYELVKEGLANHNKEYKLIRLDENAAYSPLLTTITKEERNFNVAIGSAYICEAYKNGLLSMI